MKKVLLVFFCLPFCLCNAMMADERLEIVLLPECNKDNVIHPSHPKVPIHSLCIYLEGNTLFFGTSHSEYEILILQNGSAVFDTIVQEDVDNIDIPSSIVGECEIHLICNDITFLGFVLL